ncbi:MAG: ImmA/IrrE family metallo-endopeptidase [Bdellovibrionota bacterium]
MNFQPSRVLYAAECLLKQLGWEDKEPPFSPLEAIRSLYEGRVIISTTAEFSKGENGCVYLDPDIPEATFIALNRNDPLCTKTATLAHELGHLFLGHPLGGLGGCLCRIEGQVSEGNVIEREANTFMSEFLVPLNTLDRYFSKDISLMRKKDPEGFQVETDLLSLQFGVSTAFVLTQLWRLHRQRKDRWGL